MACRPAPAVDGVRVLRAELWGAAYQAGIRENDLILSWHRDSESGPVRSPLDIELAILEQSPRGEVELSYQRDGHEHRAALRHADWALTTAPLESDASVWHRVEQARAVHASSEAEERGGHVAELLRDLDDPRLTGVLLEHGMQPVQGFRLADFEDGVQHVRAQLPGSPLLGWHLDWLGWSQHLAFDERAEETLREALALYEALPNAEVERSQVLNHLANHELRRGNYEAAEVLYREAHAVRAKLAPGSPRNGALLGNLGLALRRQGRLDEAERTTLEALREGSKFAPRGLHIGYPLRNLGLLALDKGDYDAAQSYYEQALSIFEEVRPDSVEVAGMTLNLGNIAKDRGKLQEAERRYRHALELWSALEYNPLAYASCQHNLGQVLLQQGRLAEAKDHLEAALAIKEQRVAGSPLVSTTLFSLGVLSRQLGELDRAEALHQRALAIRRAVTPDTADTAESLFALARVADDRGLVEVALSRRLEAVEILESQRDRLVFGDDERSRFSARFHEEYRALAEFFVDTGRAKEGFEFLESSRGRSLRALMSQREIRRGALRELVSERKRAEQRLSRVRSRLARAPAGDDAVFRTLHAELQELQADIDDVRERMGRAVPAIALEDALREFSTEKARSALLPSTKLLSYSVGPERTLVFIVSAAGTEGPDVQVREIAVERDALAALVERFRAFIERGRVTTEIEPALLRIGHELYRTLWAPLEEDLRDVERAVIIAEGPLLSLPFAALVESVESRTFLAEKMALSFATSAAVLTVQSEEPKNPTLALVALGDPDASASRAKLPHAREEVAKIAKLFSGELGIYQGSEATEAQYKAEASSARFVHVAAHAELDEQFPLSSAIALAPGGGSGPVSEDGRLHAWEVIEQLQLQAELVVLSGCDTGRGRELSGEGMLGLERAFRVAGAESVLASLWQVSDRSTSELMVRFYEELQSGTATDLSLVVAQRRLAETKTWGHPYHWAGFRLSGSPTGGSARATPGSAQTPPTAMP